MNRPFYLNILVFLITCSGSLPLFAGLHAKVNRTQISIDEPLTLVIEKTGQQTRDSPDFEILERDFQIESQSSATSYAFGNNTREFKQTWTLTLIAKQIGVIKIPPISLGNEHTAPIEIKVAASGQVNLMNHRISNWPHAGTVAFACLAVLAGLCSQMYAAPGGLRIP